MKKISVVVPCFNEQEVLPSTNLRLVNFLSGLENYDYEIIYVNDGSSDRTANILVSMRIANQRIRIINLSRNFGHQAAILAGLRSASGDCMAVIDADLQDPPEVIFQMLCKWNEGFQVIYGVRRNRKENFFLKKMYSMYYKFLQMMSNIDIPLDSGDFCLMDKRVVQHLVKLPESNKFIRGLRSWIGFNQIGLEYERDKRQAGESKYSLLNLINLGLDGILAFSMKPIRFMIVTGFFLALLSFILAIIFISQRILHIPIFGVEPGSVPGWLSLALLILFFGGVQLLTLGMIGEYVGRTYMEGKKRPEYIVSDE